MSKRYNLRLDIIRPDGEVEEFDMPHVRLSIPVSWTQKEEVHTYKKDELVKTTVYIRTVHCGN